MEKIITYDTLRYFAYCNDKICKKPIKGIVLTLNGLGFGDMFGEDDPLSCRFAEQGIVHIIPYYNPWSWMNSVTVAYIDELIDVIIDHYNLPDNTPVVSSGMSMGGLSALVYTRYAKRTPVACVANCPVCDLPYHYTERPDLPRTLYSAYGYYEGTMDEALRSCSPTHLVDEMPDVEYYVYHGEKDEAVNKQKHSDVFVEKMKKAHRIEYYAVPDAHHCFIPDDMLVNFYKHMTDAIARANGEL